MKTKIVDSDLAKKIAITYFNKTWVSANFTPS